MADGNLAKPELRFGFVEMLFALTVGEIAVQVADVVASGLTFSHALAAYSHLALALGLVATSWVGWSRSKAPGNVQDVQSVFSSAFLVLLLDVLLVIFYFIIVKGVDIVREINGQIRVKPSAANETLWVMVVFGGYFIWDVVTKAVIGNKKSTWLHRFFSKDLWERGWVSVVCFTLALIAWLKLDSVTRESSVLLADASLFSLVFLFRAMKLKSWGWAIATGLGYVVFFIMATH